MAINNNTFESSLDNTKDLDTLPVPVVLFFKYMLHDTTSTHTNNYNSHISKFSAENNFSPQPMKKQNICKSFQCITSFIVECFMTLPFLI